MCACSFINLVKVSICDDDDGGDDDDGDGDVMMMLMLMVVMLRAPLLPQPLTPALSWDL